MDSAKTDLAEKLKSANNILVTVSRNPSVDQLAACIGLTLMLNKLGKHAAAIFSGQVPSTLEFLQPEETLEKNTDSLRDFIIALDKSKADKLRYKVEDNVVRIFITPYRTSINQDDLEFSQGDFNVDVVVALGVRQQEDLDNAITMHGRILHDAVVASVNTTPDGGLGSISWHDAQASSLSELVTELAQAVGDDLLDSQIATALLTGIVAATDRFSNDKTTSQTMNASAKLMAAGANQQLVASKLEASPPSLPPTDVGTDQTPSSGATASSDGTLEIKHEAGEAPHDEPASMELPPVGSPLGSPAGLQPGLGLPSAPAANPFPSIGPTVPGDLSSMLELPTPQIKPMAEVGPARGNGPGGYMNEEPAMGGTLTANTNPEALDPVTDPLSLASHGPDHMLDHAGPASSEPPASTMPSFAPAQPSLPPVPVTPPSPNAAAPSTAPTSAPDGQTLADIERSVNSPHINQSNLGQARDEVNQALVSDSVAHPEPIQALGAQPLGAPLHPADMPGEPALPTPAAPGAAVQPTPSASTPSPPGNPGSVIAPSAPADPNAPPPVPPPFTFQFGTPPGPPATPGTTL